MKRFSFSELNRRSGEILDAAMKEPVALLKRGNAQVVMVPADLYQRLLDRQYSRTEAYSLDNAPDDVLQDLKEGFEELAETLETSNSPAP